MSRTLLCVLACLQALLVAGATGLLGTPWVTVLSKGAFGPADLGEAMTNALFKASGIFRRRCSSCVDTHQEVYYLRTSVIPVGFSIYSNIRSNWQSNSNSMINKDFELYSSYTDLLRRQNAWLFCNYDDPGVGFPRDCSPTATGIGYQWNNFETSGPHAGQNQPDVEFEVLGEPWMPVLAKGSYGPVDLGEAVTNALFSASRIFRRLCSTCLPSHREVYYQWTPGNAIPPTFSVYSNMRSNWKSSNNALHTNFELYSTYSDLLLQRNPWSFCNFDDPGVGFPRDCGPNARVPSQWNNFETSGPYAGQGQAHVQFEVLASPWVPVLSKGSFGVADAGAGVTNALFEVTGIFRRFCAGCVSTHKEMYYRRISAIPATFSVYSNMRSNWKSNDNILNQDFKLYSYYKNFLLRQNDFTSCNYDDPGVGFARDCGGVGGQWNNFEASGPYAGLGQPDVKFEVLGTPWHQVLSKGKYGVADVGEDTTNALFGASKIFRRLCANCVDSHKEVYYLRTSAIPTTFSMYWNLRSNWQSTNNIIFQDFQLFSSYADLVLRQSAWNFCNYDDPGVGFPRDCGPSGNVKYQWNNFEYVGPYAGAGPADVTFEVLGAAPVYST